MAENNGPGFNYASKIDAYLQNEYNRLAGNGGFISKLSDSFKGDSDATAELSDSGIIPEEFTQEDINKIKKIMEKSGGSDEIKTVSEALEKLETANKKKTETSKLTQDTLQAEASIVTGAHERIRQTDEFVRNQQAEADRLQSEQNEKAEGEKDQTIDISPIQNQQSASTNINESKTREEQLAQERERREAAAKAEREANELEVVANRAWGLAEEARGKANTAETEAKEAAEQAQLAQVQATSAEERSVVAAEEARVSAEQARIAAEQARIAAEQAVAAQLEAGSKGGTATSAEEQAKLAKAVLDTAVKAAETAKESEMMAQKAELNAKFAEKRASDVVAEKTRNVAAKQEALQQAETALSELNEQMKNSPPEAGSDAEKKLKEDISKAQEQVDKAKLDAGTADLELSQANDNLEKATSASKQASQAAKEATIAKASRITEMNAARNDSGLKDQAAIKAREDANKAAQLANEKEQASRLANQASASAISKAAAMGEDSRIASEAAKSAKENADAKLKEAQMARENADLANANALKLEQAARAASEVANNAKEKANELRQLAGPEVDNRVREEGEPEPPIVAEEQVQEGEPEVGPEQEGMPNIQVGQVAQPQVGTLVQDQNQDQVQVAELVQPPVQEAALVQEIEVNLPDDVSPQTPEQEGDKNEEKYSYVVENDVVENEEQPDLQVQEQEDQSNLQAPQVDPLQEFLAQQQQALDAASNAPVETSDFQAETSSQEQVEGETNPIELNDISMDEKPQVMDPSAAILDLHSGLVVQTIIKQAGLTAEVDQLSDRVDKLEQDSEPGFIATTANTIANAVINAAQAFDEKVTAVVLGPAQVTQKSEISISADAHVPDYSHQEGQIATSEGQKDAPQGFLSKLWEGAKDLANSVKQAVITIGENLGAAMDAAGTAIKQAMTSDKKDKEGEDFSAILNQNAGDGLAIEPLEGEPKVGKVEDARKEGEPEAAIGEQIEGAPNQVAKESFFEKAKNFFSNLFTSKEDKYLEAGAKQVEGQTNLSTAKSSDGLPEIIDSYNIKINNQKIAGFIKDENTTPNEVINRFLSPSEQIEPGQPLSKDAREKLAFIAPKVQKFCGGEAYKAFTEKLESVGMKLKEDAAPKDPTAAKDTRKTITQGPLAGISIDTSKPEISKPLNLDAQNGMRVSNGLRQPRVYMKLNGEMPDGNEQAKMQKMANENGCKLNFHLDKKGIARVNVEPLAKEGATAKPNKEDQIKGMAKTIENLSGKKPDMQGMIDQAKTKISSNMIRVPKGEGFSKKAEGQYQLDVRIKVGGKRESLSDCQKDALCSKLQAKFEKRLKDNPEGYKEKYKTDQVPKFSFNEKGKLQVDVAQGKDNQAKFDQADGTKRMLASVKSACDKGPSSQEPKQTAKLA